MTVLCPDEGALGVALPNVANAKNVMHVIGASYNPLLVLMEVITEEDVAWLAIGHRGRLEQDLATSFDTIPTRNEGGGQLIQVGTNSSQIGGIDKASHLEISTYLVGGVNKI